MTNRANNGITRRIVPCVLAGVLLLAGTFGVPAQNEPLRSGTTDQSSKRSLILEAKAKARVPTTTGSGR